MPVSNRLRQALRSPLLLSFYLPALLLSLSQSLVVPIMPLYARSMDASYGLIGLVSAGVGLGTLLGDVPSGMMVRRLGQKRTMLLGVGCTVFSTAALFWARSIPEVVIYRLLTGFGQALYTVSRHAYIADAVRVSGRGRAIALFGGVSRAGRFIAPLIGGTIAKAYGLRVPFLVVGLMSAAAFATMVAFVRNAETTPQEAGSAPRSRGGHLLSTLRSQRRVLASAGVGQLFAQMIRAGRKIIIPLYAADVIGLDVQAIGFIVSFASAVDMTLFLPAGLIMDRLGRKYAIVPSFVIQAVGMALVPLTSSATGLLLAATLIGIGNGLSSGSMMTLGADLAPLDTRSEFLGLWRLIGDVGGSSGPIIVGSVAEVLALPAAAMAISSAGLLAGAIFALLVPETLKKRQRVVEPSLSGD